MPPADRSYVEDVADLKRAVDRALRTRAFLDYRAVHRYAAEGRPVVDALTAAARGPAGRDVVPVVERALAHVVRVLLHGDDSSGVAADLARDLLDAHRDACAAYPPPPKKLLRWLVRFTFEDQDFFNPDIRDYAEALGDAGVAAYRDEVRRRHTLRPDGFAAQHALGQLALLDRDEDAIVRLFGGDLSNQHWFTNVAKAFREIGDDESALSWALRGLELPTTWQSRKLYDVACDVYTARGDVDAAVDARRACLSDLPELASYVALRHAAEPLHRWGLLRPAALAVLDERSADYHLLALLDDGDVDRAWESFNDETRPLWTATVQALADARGETHPADAVPYARRAVEAMLETSDRRNYRKAVRLIRKLQALHGRAGTDTEFDDYLSDLAAANRHRPSLIDELQKSGLLAR